MIFLKANNQDVVRFIKNVKDTQNKVLKVMFRENEHVASE